MAIKTNFFVEFNGNQVDQKDILDKAKEVWKNNGNKIKDLATADLYYKPEEGKVYYVFNGKTSDSFEI